MNRGTIKQYLIVRQEGSRKINRPVIYYNLDTIIAVGFRVRSHRGIQFRLWATSQDSVSKESLITASDVFL